MSQRSRASHWYSPFRPFIYLQLIPGIGRHVASPSAWECWALTAQFVAGRPVCNEARPDANWLRTSRRILCYSDDTLTGQIWNGTMCDGNRGRDHDVSEDNVYSRERSEAQLLMSNHDAFCFFSRIRRFPRRMILNENPRNTRKTAYDPVGMSVWAEVFAGIQLTDPAQRANLDTRRNLLMLMVEW